MSRSCPICLGETELERCECGYDFATGDRTVAAERARKIRNHATSKAQRGILMLVTLPLTIAAAVLVPNVLLRAVCFLAFPLQLGAGIGGTVRGIRWRRSAQQRFDRSTRPAELPAARVIR